MVGVDEWKCGAVVGKEGEETFKAMDRACVRACGRQVTPCCWLTVEVE